MSDRDSASRSEHSSGFERFWKKSTSPPETQFIDESPAASSTKKDRSGFSRLFSRANGSSSKIDDKGERRRQQIYSAQKRHRNRKDEYIKNLEAEIEKLRSLDSAINTERITLEHENQKMRDRLAGLSNGVSNNADLTFASVYVQHDPTTNQDRVFVEDVKAHENDPNDSWIAMDFILALEWPCRGHHDHPVTSSASSSGPACPDADIFHGHGMTMTGAVLSSLQNPHAPAPSFQSVDREDLDPEILKKWKLPHSEIDKLVKLAERLPLDDDVFTPAQAYAATKAVVKDPAQLKATLEKLKVSLADISDCEGFGAVMSSEKFGERLHEALSS